jgi:hypothetical protein
LSAVRAAVRPSTRLLWTETPSNPTIAVTDLAGVAAIAKEAGALSACDNTWATPFLQRPLRLGMDLVMHSTTKYLSGHSDVMGGIVVAREDGRAAERLRAFQSAGGAVPAPFDAWLTLRGIRTLPWRMRAHCANARAVAGFLAEHPGVERVHYPGLPRDPGHALAAKQMADAGGMLSFVVPGGRARAFEVAARLRLFTRATSLGGPESLIEHRASIEGERTRAPEGLLGSPSGSSTRRTSWPTWPRPGRMSASASREMPLAPLALRPGATLRHPAPLDQIVGKIRLTRRPGRTTPGTSPSTSPPPGSPPLPFPTGTGRSRSPSTSWRHELRVRPATAGRARVPLEPQSVATCLPAAHGR